MMMALKIDVRKVFGVNEGVGRFGEVKWSPQPCRYEAENSRNQTLETKTQGYSKII